jgi:hypothetical protein
MADRLLRPWRDKDHHHTKETREERQDQSEGQACATRFGLDVFLSHREDAEGVA